jgi:hypothetical protein
VGAPRPAASPFWRMITAPATGASAVLHARRKRSISRSAVVVEPMSRSGTQSDGKKIAFVQCAASAASVLSVYSVWRPRIEYSS